MRIDWSIRELNNLWTGHGVLGLYNCRNSDHGLFVRELQIVDRAAEIRRCKCGLLKCFALEGAERHPSGFGTDP